MLDYAFNCEVDYDALNEEQKEVADIIGFEAYRKLIFNYGGQSLYIPLQDTINKVSRDKNIISDYQKGISYRKISRKYSLSEVRIRDIVKKMLASD